MKALFKPKKLLEISQVNAKLASPQTYVAQCEETYAGRVAEATGEIFARHCRIVMLSGPSASGKTTSALKIAAGLTRRGRCATVVSLDNFFRNIGEYPRTPQGGPDFEHLEALDVDRINHCLKELIETGSCDMPTYDFLNQRRADEILRIEAGEDEIVIIEGIHALNPLLTQSIRDDSRMLRIYVGLRAEYSEDGRRVLATRDLRIVRRIVRDHYFRGHSVRNTLELWGRLQQGEERWIKPFRSTADLLLDTSFEYEPALFAPLLAELCADPEEGGEFRSILLDLAKRFGWFSGLELALVPPDSMLREFAGGLEL